MFKRLKKTIISGTARDAGKKRLLSNSDTSSGDDSICKPDNTTSLKASSSKDSTIDQEIFNLGGDLGLMSLDQTGKIADESTLLYTTAIEPNDTILHSHDSSSKTIMDHSYTSEESENLCVTALENICEESIVETTPQPGNSVPASSSVDPLEDCLAAFGNLSLSSRNNTPKAAPEQKAFSRQAILSHRDRLISDGSPLSSSYLVIDFDANGQAVERDGHYCVRDNLAMGDTTKNNQSPLVLPNLDEKSQVKVTDNSKVDSTIEIGNNLQNTDIVCDENLFDNASMNNANSMHNKNATAVQEDEVALSLQPEQVDNVPIARGSYSLDLSAVDSPGLMNSPTTDMSIRNDDITKPSEVSSTDECLKAVPITEGHAHMLDLANSEEIEEIPSVKHNTDASVKLTHGTQTDTVEDIAIPTMNTELANSLPPMTCENSVTNTRDSTDSQSNFQSLPVACTEQINTEDSVKQLQTAAVTDLPPVCNDDLNNIQSQDQNQPERKIAANICGTKANACPQNRSNEILTDNTCDESDCVILPEGAYTIDFNQLDDFDPFKSTKAMANSPTKNSPSHNSKNGNTDSDSENTNTLFFDALDEVQDQDLQTNELADVSKFDETESSSPTEIPGVDETLVLESNTSKENVDNVLDEVSNLLVGLNANSQIEPSMVISNQSETNGVPQQSKYDQDNITPEDFADASDIPFEKGSYSIDFAQIGSADFNPFQSNKGLANSPTNNSMHFATSLEETLPTPTTFLPENCNTEISSNMLSTTLPNVTDVTAVSDIGTSSTANNVNSDLHTANNASLGEQRPAPVSAEADALQVSDNSNEKDVARCLYSLDLSKIDMDDFDPFASKGGLSNSPTKPSSDDIFISTIATNKDEVKALVDISASNIDNYEVSADRHSDIATDTPDIANAEPMSDAVTSQEIRSDEATKINVNHSLHDTIDLVDFDPIKSEGGLINSPTNASPSNSAISVEKYQNEPDTLLIKQTIVSSCDATVDSQSEDTKISNIVSAGILPGMETTSTTADDYETMSDTSTVVGQDDINEQLLPKGSYTMDFDQLDDPNFDPFKTSASLTNEEESIPISMGAYSIDFSQFDDPNFDPFKTKTGVGNSPTKSSFSKSPVHTVATNADEKKDPVEVQPEKKSSMHKKKSPLKNKVKANQQNEAGNTASTIPIQDKVEDSRDITDESSVPTGAYSIDFNQIDDLNFDPFKTNKGLLNNEEKSLVKESSSSNVEPIAVDSFMTEDNSLPAIQSDSSDLSALVGKLVPDEEKAPEEATNKKVQNKSKSKFKATSKATDTSGQMENSSQQPLGNSIPTDEDNADPLAQKGAYSIDFSKFDDPNFNPFQTNKSLINDEVNADELVAKGNYSMDFSKFDDPNFDPFKTSKGVANSPTEADKPFSTVLSTELEKQDLPDTDSTTGLSSSDVVEKTKKKTVKSSSKPKARSKLLKTNKLKKPDENHLSVEPQISNNVTVEENVDQPTQDIPAAKGAYTMDYSKFDDPNFDPFKTNKGLSNDDNSSESLPAKGGYSMDFSKFDDPNFDPFKTSKGIGNSPTDESKSISMLPEAETASQSINNSQEDVDKENSKENVPSPKRTNRKSKPKGKSTIKRSALAALKKKNQAVNNENIVIYDTVDVVPPTQGAYSVDFSKFDDPNFDPFKSNKGLANDDAALDVAPPTAEYSLDSTNFDDPNFDPFQSKRGLASSPTKEKSFTSKTLENNTKENRKESDDFPDRSLSESLNKTVILADETNVPNEKAKLSPKVLKKLNTLIESQQIKQNIEYANENFSDDPTSDQNFCSADKVFSNDDSLKTWDDLWNKENASSNEALDSDLRKQSLYVQFDPLVQPMTAIDNAMSRKDAEELTTENADSLRFENLNNVLDRTLTEEHMQEDLVMMTSDPPQLHPAASRLLRSMSDEKWNEQEAQEGAGGINFISFSPGSTYKVGQPMQGATTHSAVQSEVQSPANKTSLLDDDEDSIIMKQEMMRLKEEKMRIAKKKENVRQSIEIMKLNLEGCKITIKDLEAINNALNNELEVGHMEQRRVLDDMMSAKRVYHDYHIKASELLPVLKAHKQANDELRVNIKRREEELNEKTKKYNSLKKDADSTKARLSSELANARAAVEREIGALQAKYKREQMSIASITSSLQDKKRENEELTKICDELIAGAEHKS